MKVLPALCFILSSSLLYNTPLFAQQERVPFAVDEKARYLVMDKMGSVKRIRFFIGDQITFKFKDEKHIYSGTILHILPHALIIKEALVPLDDIDKIYLEREGYWMNMLGTFSKVSIFQGKLFIGLGVAAAAVPAARKEGLNIAAGGLVFYTMGQLVKPLLRRNYKIGKKRKLKVIEGTHPNTSL